MRLVSQELLEGPMQHEVPDHRSQYVPSSFVFTLDAGVFTLDAGKSIRKQGIAALFEVRNYQPAPKATNKQMQHHPILHKAVRGSKLRPSIKIPKSHNIIFNILVPKQSTKANHT
jgi:hypothetical protein